MNRIKIAFICHFSNQEIRNKLPISSFKLKNRIKKLLGKNEPYGYSDFAPWVSILIKEFEKFENVELHVIAPHQGLKQSLFEFSNSEVHYHIFKPDVPLLHINWPSFFKNYSAPNFTFNRNVVSRLIQKIKPDIVNLIGAENPYYSITAIDIENIPVYVLLQAVLSTPFKDKYKFIVDKHRLEVERNIFQRMNYFGTASSMYGDCVLNLNSNAKIFEFWFPTQLPPKIITQTKVYDFVFFAKVVSQIKGIDETLEALAIVKEYKNDIKLNVVGLCESGFKRLLIERILELDIEENIEFSDYFQDHRDMFIQVKKSKIAVLPNKLDVLSSTIREAMFLEIPIATTITTGTPYLNVKNQTVLLSEIGDIEELANNMYRLLIDDELCGELARNAKALAEEVFDNTAIAKKLVKDNLAIVEHFIDNKTIPQELLFNPDNYPEY
jgi:glycosyltransferase involved in cell wall biosynthesis